MPFGTTGKINIILNGKEIENVSEYKDLGVMLDTNLLFEKQVDFAFERAKRLMER